MAAGSSAKEDPASTNELEKKAAVTVSSEQWHEAISKQDLQTVRALLKSGADPNVHKDTGWGPLEWCVSCKSKGDWHVQYTIMLELLAARADYTNRINVGLNALGIATDSRSLAPSDAAVAVLQKIEGMGREEATRYASSQLNETNAATNASKDHYSTNELEKKAVEDDVEHCDVLDIPQLIEQNHCYHYALVAAQVIFWVGITFLLAVDVSGADWIFDVDCGGGLPLTWKFTVLAFLAAFMVLELWFVWQTKVGKHLIRKEKKTVVVACGLGFLARYDAFSDICFTMLARACNSRIGTWSLYFFIFGVLVAQGIPAFWYLLRQKSSHLALKLNDLLLLLEAIDPCRGDLDLPERVQRMALEETPTPGVATADDETSSLLVTPSNPDAVNVEWATFAGPQSVEEAQRLKAELQVNTTLDEAEPADDPDVVKKKALIAHAKMLGGAIRFLCEDLIQGVLQVAYLWEHWDTTPMRTKLFIISSTLTGVLVSLGSPVYAMKAEADNKDYYSRLPKMRNGETWQGISCHSGKTVGKSTSSYTVDTFTAKEVAKLPGETIARVKFKVRTQVILRECNGESKWSEALPQGAKSYLNPTNYSIFESDLEGTYDVNTAILSAKTVKLNLISSKTGQPKFDYNLRVLPDRLIGTADSKDYGGYSQKIVLKRMRAKADKATEP